MPSGEMAAPEDLESFESVNVFVKKFETTMQFGGSWSIQRWSEDISRNSYMGTILSTRNGEQFHSMSPRLVTRCPGSNPVTAECDRLPAILLLYIISLLDISGRHSIVAVSGATWVNRLHLKWFSWECEVNTYNLVSKTFDSTWLYELQAFDQQDWHGNDDFLAVLRHL